VRILLERGFHILVKTFFEDNIALICINVHFNSTVVSLRAADVLVGCDRVHQMDLV